MSRRVVKLRPAARRDVAAGVQWYAKEGGMALADRFVASVGAAFEYIAHHSASGSPRYAAMLGLMGLRHRPLKDFPFLVFYIDGDAWIDVLRVLHASRDIPESLRM